MTPAFHVEILVEEASMKNLLKVILPQILPDGYQLGVNCFIRQHEGKQHLQKSIPRRVKGLIYYPQSVKLIIIQDQDSNDCIALKQKLKNYVRKTGTLQL